MRKRSHSNSYEIPRLFGTDGVRGVANEPPMTVEMAVNLGRAVAAYFRKQHKRCHILIGKDTRRSGYLFEHALVAGVCSAGAEPLLVGPLPTPGIAFMTIGMRADAGVVISASHNPFEDNGIKIFGGDGYKLPDDAENEIEDLISDPARLDATLVRGAEIGRARRIDDAPGRYIVSLKNCFPRDLTLEGVRIAVDCANGAAYKVAPAVLRELGADVVTVGDEPDGTNINAGCGALHPEDLGQVVVRERCDFGIALDGDADRCILVDERGQVVDGDHALALCADRMRLSGTLSRKTLVVTVMSNFGLELAMRARGITVLRTPVGDRYVVEEMRRGGYNLGGEQSGHIIFLDHTTTGDGLLSALQVLAIAVREQRSLSELAAIMESAPQVRVDFKVRDKPSFASLTGVEELIAETERELDGRGRVLVRYSGTEPKCRVMVEGDDAVIIRACADRIADAIKQHIGS